MTTDDPSSDEQPPAPWWQWVHDRMIEQWGRPNWAQLGRMAEFDRASNFHWKRGRVPEVDTVTAVADALHASRVEALVAAGIVSADDLQRYAATLNVSNAVQGLSHEALAAEVLLRMKRADPANGDLAEQEQPPQLRRGPREPTGRRDSRRSDDRATRA